MRHYVVLQYNAARCRAARCRAASCHAAFHHPTGKLTCLEYIKFSSSIDK
jgi:hypothetical protein